MRRRIRWALRRACGSCCRCCRRCNQSARQIDTRFGSDAVVRAPLHHNVGAIDVALGAIEPARPHLEQAVALYEANGERGTRRHVEALFIRMEAFEELADFDAARAAALRTQAEAERAFGADNEWAPRLIANRAWYDMHQGRFDSARTLARDALARKAQRSGGGSRDDLRVATIAAHVYMETSDVLPAAEVFRQIRQGGERIAGYASGDRLMDRYNLARARFVLFDDAAIEPELRELVPAMDKHLGSRHDRSIIGWLLLAQTVALQGHFDEGIALQRAKERTMDTRSLRRARGSSREGRRGLLRLTLLNDRGRRDPRAAPVRLPESTRCSALHSGQLHGCTLDAGQDAVRQLGRKAGWQLRAHLGQDCRRSRHQIVDDRLRWASIGRYHAVSRAEFQPMAAEDVLHLPVGVPGAHGHGQLGLAR